jgi:hypothetical protein
MQPRLQQMTAVFRNVIADPAGAESQSGREDALGFDGSESLSRGRVDFVPVSRLPDQGTLAL